ncbi:hypothetical protein SALBM135S_04838 [Streptomyces alboniger]
MYQRVMRPSVPCTTTYGSSCACAHSVAATATRMPPAVETRTHEVSSDSMAWARKSSVSTAVTSSAAPLSARARAVATAWARGLVRTPSTTSAPSRRRRPAHGARRKYASSRTHAPAPPTPVTSPIAPSAMSRRAAGTACEPSDWNPIWTAVPAAAAPSAMRRNSA